jgi:hypothetical protein
MKLSAGQADLKTCDDAGNIITDTRMARMEEQRKRALLGVKFAVIISRERCRPRSFGYL